jgi:metal-sulfur cluster biosynthetic enzyme
MNDKELYKFRVDLKYALKRVIDPEMGGIDIYELGLIREMNIIDDQDIEIKMILTSPACPVADELLAQVKKEVSSVEGVRNVAVELLMEPWDHSMLKEEARLALGIYDW